MDIDNKIVGTATDVEAVLESSSEGNSFVFSGSININNTNSSYVFNFVNAATLSYILNEAKAHGEVTVEIFRYDEASEVIQQQDHTRYTI